MTIGRKTRVFLLVILLWLALDIATKVYFVDNFERGDFAGELIPGLVRLRLVHNTGAAWGIFDDSTMFLGFLSLFICLVIVGFFVFMRSRLNLGEVVALALALAGGLGNALNRFTLGYVIDFFEFSFIDFPVFNVADMGVSCGVVLFFLSYLLREKKRSSVLAHSMVAEESLSPGRMGDEAGYAGAGVGNEAGYVGAGVGNEAGGIEGERHRPPDEGERHRPPDEGEPLP